MERNIVPLKPGEKEPIKYRTEVNRLHYYYTNFYPDLNTLVQEFINQIGKSLDCLKIKGWKGHTIFKKYLQYLEDSDDRFADWDSNETRELDPTEILKKDPEFIDPIQKGNKDDKDKNIALIREPIAEAYRKCEEFLSQLNPYLQVHFLQKSINRDYLLEEDLIEQDDVFRLLTIFTEKNITTLKKFIPFQEDIGLIKLTFEENLRKELIAEQNSIWIFLKEKLVNSYLKLAFYYEKKTREYRKMVF